MTNLQVYESNELKKEEWNNVKCDKYDLMIACSCGAIAGLIDIFLVVKPKKSKLGNITDDAADELVKKFAKMNGWNPRAGNENNVGSAIGFLERNFKVNYDQKNTQDVNGLFNMSSKNHHYKSLSHSPDIVGLFFSILDQFTNKSSFFNDGQLIRINTSGGGFKLDGNNLHSKLYCGFCNWLGHIMSDLAGSSGSRGKGLKGRGMGVSIPFFEFFQLCNFGSFQIEKDRQDLATLMTRVFQEGYDLRFLGAMAIPVFIEEMMIKVLWSIRNHFDKNKPWRECIPSKKHADLRLMLIVGNATLCILDGVDAMVKSKGNSLNFILHLNLLAWFKLIIMVIREMIIVYGPMVKIILNRFMSEIIYMINTSEQEELEAYYNRMKSLNESLGTILKEFIAEVEREYALIHREIEDSFSENKTKAEQAAHSVKAARLCGVSEDKIIHDLDELDNFFNSKY